jgi:type II secretion system protein J
MRRGFTLIEVVVALGVMVLIAGLSWTTMSGSIRLRDALEQQDELYRSARVGLDRIENELRLAFLTSNVQAVGTYRTVFVGKDGGDEDQLWFAALSHQRKYFNAREGDQSELTIWVEDGPKDKGRILMHRESGQVDHEPDKTGQILPMISHVTEFNLRYLDGQKNEWQEEWDSTGTETPNRLPRAVEITLTIEKEDPDDRSEELKQTFLNTVVIEMAVPITRSALGGNGTPSSPLGGMMK